MKNVVRINLMSLVQATGSNSEGYALFLQMENAILKGDSIELSLQDATPFSSSFLNSSFGALWEKFGDIELKGRVKITNFQPSRRDQIVDYLTLLKQVANRPD